MAAALASAVSFSGAAQAKDDALRLRCDPDWPSLSSAIQLRDAGDANAARPILGRVIARNPKNFGALYVMGTVALQNPSDAGQKEGLSYLLQALSIFKDQRQECAVELGWYSIYNTIGVQYYKVQQRDRAIFYYSRGYSYLNYMLPNTKQNLLNNMGLYYFSQGDLPNAKRYYQEAAAAGYVKARKHLAVISAIETAKAKTSR